MAIYTPEPYLTENDKRLLALLARLLAEKPDGTSLSNYGSDLALSEAEWDELEQRIDQKLADQEFFRATRLIEQLSRGEKHQSRELYLQGRTMRGRSRVMSSKQFDEFLSRLGQRDTRGWGFAARPMSVEHFLRMERRLFRNLNVNERTINLLMRFIELQIDEVGLAREGRRPLQEWFVSHALKSFLYTRSNGDRGGSLLTTNRIAGALTLIANFSVMYTTRDWSVTGTISSMAGAIGMTVGGTEA